MADNAELNAGSGGITLHTDDLGGTPAVHVQRVKIGVGVDGSFADVSDSAPLPVDDAGGSLTVDGTVTADAGTGPWPVTDNSGSLTIDNTAIDNTHSEDFDTGAGTDTTTAIGIAVPASGGAVVVPGDATAGLKVDLGADNDVTVTGSVTANAGTNLNTSALALETGGNLATVAGAVSGSEMQVDVVAALPAGTNAIGKLAANSGVDIGDVDVLSVVPGAGATNLGKAEDAAHSTGDVGVMALAVRRAADTPTSGTDGDYEPLKTDANGHLKVEVFDGGDSHTVDNGGTFAVQVDAALPAGTNAIGKLAANSGVDIGDVDVTSLDGVAAEGAALGNGILLQGDDGTDRKNVNVDATTGDVQVDVTNTVTVSGTVTADAGSGTFTVDETNDEARLKGVVRKDVDPSDGTTQLTTKFAVVSESTAADNEIVALVGGKKIRVLSLSVVCAAANTLTWKSSTAGAISGAMSFAANGGYTLSSDYGLFETTAGEALQLGQSGATQVSGHVSYVEV